MSQIHGTRGMVRKLIMFCLASISAVAAPPASAADVFKGGEIFRQYCAACHGADGKPMLVGAPNFARGERLQRMDLDLLESVRNGKNAMPAFKGILTNQQILDVIAHLRTLSK